MPVMQFSPIKDCRIRSGTPDTNDNTLRLRVGNQSPTSEADRSLLHFDISTLPAGVSIYYSELLLRCDLRVGDPTFKACRLTQPNWIETEVDWNEYTNGVAWVSAGGDFTTTDQLSWLPTFSESFTPVADLTTLVNDAINNRSSQLHLLLKGDVEAAGGGYGRFKDKEDGTPSWRPVLSIYYTIVSGAGNMGQETIPGVDAIPPSLDGYNCTLPGSGRNIWIPVRNDTDGTIANAETLLSIGNSNGQLPNGLINVSRATGILVYANITFAALTTVDIIPLFYDDLNGVSGYLTGGALSAGVITVSKLVYRIAAALTGVGLIIPIANPGANYMALSMASAGTITSSNALVKVGFGWNGKNILGL